MTTIPLLVPSEPAGRHVVLFDYHQQNIVYIPQTLRKDLRQLVTDLDVQVYDRLKSLEFSLINFYFNISTISQEKKHRFTYKEGGGFFIESTVNDCLYLLRDEYAGYVPSFARTLQEFRKMGPQYPLLDVKIVIEGFSDVITTVVQAQDPRGPSSP